LGPNQEARLNQLGDYDATTPCSGEDREADGSRIFVPALATYSKAANQFGIQQTKAHALAQSLNAHSARRNRN
jgi:hypothetical protein